MSYTRQSSTRDTQTQEGPANKVVSPKFNDQRNSTQVQLKQQDLMQSKSTAQREGMEEDELKQAKLITQREGMEEDELKQAKFTTQLASAEQQDNQLGKSEPLQRASLEEEQPAQAKGNNTGLPDNLKFGIENLSGYAMNDVKVHYNSDKPAQLNAHAYAQGTDIHVAPGQEKHLPHEAWHVVQQKQGRVQPTMQMQGQGVNDDAGLEHEADLMGSRAVSLKQKQPSEKPHLSQLKTNAIAQRKLIFYNSKAEAVELDNFAAVVNAAKGKGDATAVRAKIIEGINNKLTENESSDRFNAMLMDQFIASDTGYLNIGSASELIESLCDFYVESLGKFLKKSEDIEKSKSYSDLKGIYDDTEGDDGLSVGEEYSQGLACTLFALLAVKGSYLGASTPEELHKIFQAIDKFKAYDEDANVGLIRIQAGLNYSTLYSGKTVQQMVDGLEESDRNKKFIIDLDGVAHTFALKYVDGWKRFDNGSNQGYKTGAEIGGYASKKISVTWQ